MSVMPDALGSPSDVSTAGATCAAERCNWKKNPCALRRPKSCMIFLLVASVGLRCASGFGLSLRTPATSHSGVSLGCFSSLNNHAIRHRVKQLDGNRGCRRRGRGARLITCKISSPKRYGSSDWMSNIANLPKSRLLYNIRGHLIFNSSFAFFVSLVHFLTPQHIIDDLHVSPIPHTIMAGALGLLLVFRTNAAYNRFWEARKVWGGVTNTCRSLTRLGVVALGPDSEEWQEMKEYLRLFPFLLKQHLQDERNDDELAFSRLPREEVLHLQDDPNPPLYACQLMAEIITRAYSPSCGKTTAEGGHGPLQQDYTAVSYRMELEHGLTSLIDALGKCERILTTPVPRGYSRHTSRFLTVYGLTLPIVLVPHTELFTAPVVCTVCWGLFTIEEIAYFIEQPFDPDYRQLDLEAYSQKIARDVERMSVKSHLGPRGRRRRRWPYSSYSISASAAAAPPQLTGSTTDSNGFVSSDAPWTSTWSRVVKGVDPAVENSGTGEALKEGNRVTVEVDGRGRYGSGSKQKDGDDIIE